jgi:DNA-binding NarL/FixJ family response regulator
MAVSNIEQTDKKTIRVVIVEDYKLTRIGLCAILKDYEEIKVVGDAEDAEHGIRMIETLRPDVVLMDLGLPGMSGIDATQQVKAFDDTIKILIYSSHEGEEEVIAALGAGADAYCVKDNSVETLVNTIKLVVEGGAWLDPSIAGIALDIFRKPHGPDEEISPGKVITEVKLSERELEVLTLLVEGMSNVEIAERLIISPHTAKEHVCNILHKLSVHDRVQAAVKAIREGLV